jgi:hypothetical protein
MQRSRARTGPSLVAATPTGHGRGAIASGRGRRVGAPFKLCTQRPGSQKDPGLLFWLTAPRRGRAAACGPSDCTTGNGGSFFQNLPRSACRYWPAAASQPCGCSSTGRARPRHGRGNEFDSRHPLHFGCVHALCCRASMVLAARDVRDPWPGHVQRNTASAGMLARGHSRSGSSALAEGRQGPFDCRVRLAGRGHHPFKVGTRVRIPHATPGSQCFAS